MNCAAPYSDSVLPLPAAARFLISRITRAWSSGKVKPDALAALRRYPELWDLEGAVADLALEEYHLAVKRGSVRTFPPFVPVSSRIMRLSAK